MLAVVREGRGYGFRVLGFSFSDFSSVFSFLCMCG